eukprot:5405473-Pyramimonas_sp.AAC.1
MGVTKACGALGHVDFTIALAFGPCRPWWYFIHPSTHWLFSQVEPSEVALAHGNRSTKLNAKK